LGGRFGQFNVLTPITERTFEFTSSTRGSGTPSDRYGQVAPEEAAEVAERLAAELRQDDEEVSDESDEEELLDNGHELNHYASVQKTCPLNVILKSLKSRRRLVLSAFLIHSHWAQSFVQATHVTHSTLLFCHRCYLGFRRTPLLRLTT
jgi:hypothetical protein